MTASLALAVVVMSSVWRRAGLRWIPARNALVVAGLALGASLTVATCRPVWAAAPTSSVLRLLYEQGRVTGTLSHVRVDEALLALGRAADAEVRGTVPHAPEVSLELRSAPVVEAVQRILGSVPFTARFDAAGRLRAIDVLGDQPEQLPPYVSAPASSAPRAESASGAMSTLLGVLERQQVSPLPDRLARALGADHAALSEILKTALAHPDARIRRLAMRRAIRAIDAAPESFVPLSAVDEPRLAASVHELFGDAGRPILSAAAHHLRRPALRERARSLANALRATDDAASPGH